MSGMERPSGGSGALAGVRVCDFGGQLAGAGATKILAALGAEVIRVEDPVTRGRWDAMRGVGPFVDDRRGVDLGGGFNNHNVGKLGITLNTRTERGKELLARLVAECDVVTENFAAGVLERWGFGYERLREIRPDVVYVSNCGFGHTGPQRDFKTWGPIVQALSGLTFTAGLPGEEPSGWGFSYMDHIAAYYMTVAILAALHHRSVTGAGAHVDLASTSAGLSMLHTEILDSTVNGRPSRREGEPHGNRADFGSMSPHGVYPAEGDDRWVAIACRDDTDWQALRSLVGGETLSSPDLDHLAGRLAHADALDAALSHWTASQDAAEAAARLVAAGVPASVVATPPERIDEDAEVADWGLFPVVDHPEMGRVRVEGLPFHLSLTDWSIEAAAPCLGQHTDDVLQRLLGLGPDELRELHEEGVL